MDWSMPNMIIRHAPECSEPYRAFGARDRQSRVCNGLASKNVNYVNSLRGTSRPDIEHRLLTYHR